VSGPIVDPTDFDRGGDVIGVEPAQIRVVST
jgi:hypothetical protein